VLTYVNMIFDKLTKGEEIPSEITELFICSSHFIKIIVNQLNTKAKNKKAFKHFNLEVFALMIDCKDVSKLIQIFQNFIYVISSFKETKNVKRCIIKINDIRKNHNIEDMTDVLEEAKNDESVKKIKDEPQPTYIKSKFHMMFSNIFDEVQEKVIKDNSEHIGDNVNPHYQKGFAAFLLKQYFAYVPLWTSIVTKERLCNSPIENHFKTVKSQVIVDKSMPAHRFVNRTRDHFEARLKMIESGLFFKKVF
jgi:hypothetical protein